MIERKELPELFNIGQQFISGWPIIRVKLESLLDGSELRAYLPCIQRARVERRKRESKMHCIKVGKIAVEVSAEKALAGLCDIKSIECYEPKVDSALVLPGTQDKGTYFARGHFAGIP